MFLLYADVAKLVDAHDSKSCVVTHVGSSPTIGTNNKNSRFNLDFF